MPRTKKGEDITWKEFFKRWKKGIESITPLQQSKTIFFNTWIIVVGVVAGLYFTIISFSTLWWLFLILLGALLNTLVTQIANFQKYSALKRLEYQWKEVENESESTI